MRLVLGLSSVFSQRQAHRVFFFRNDLVTSALAASKLGSSRRFQRHPTNYGLSTAKTFTYLKLGLPWIILIPSKGFGRAQPTYV